MVYSRARPEEKLLIQAGESLGIELVSIHDEHLCLDLNELSPEFSNLDAGIIRSLGLHRGIAIARYLERWGIACFNSSRTLELTGDKWATSSLLAQSGIATPATCVSFSNQGVSRTVESLGFPLVSKPLTGSWARMVSRCNDQDALDGILEHKAFMSGQAKINYLQEFVNKPGSDIRAFVVGDRVICAIERSSEHWITNTARGAVASGLELTEELVSACEGVAELFPNGLIAVDLMESDDGFLVHEVNGVMEFRNSIQTTGVDIPRVMLEYVIESLS